MHGEYDKDGDSDAGAAFVFLLQEGTLGYEWAFVLVHFGACGVVGYRFCAWTFFSEDSGAKFSSFFLFNVFSMPAQGPKYHLCWGVYLPHPYLLISLSHKSFHLDFCNSETGQTPNRPVKAKLRRRKQHFSPLHELLLPVN
jgi:hypothetical protein